jgi:nicotinamide/nicotinate riboside kinase
MICTFSNLDSDYNQLVYICPTVTWDSFLPSIIAVAASAKMSAVHQPIIIKATNPNSSANSNLQTVIIAITGPSSSGKTTLSKYVMSILSSLLSGPGDLKPILLHQDDFYIPDSKLPTVRLSSGDEVANWDCAEALDTPRLAMTLEHLKSAGLMPEDFESIQHLNESLQPSTPYADSFVSKHTQLVKEALERLPKNTKLAVLDGFLLLPLSILEQIRPWLKAVIMLRTSRDSIIKRRAERAYATVEGASWDDPPGYVEDVVWPGYVKDHSALFHDGDVNGKAKSHAELQQICGLDVEISPPDIPRGVEAMLDWGIDAFVGVINSIGMK